MGYADAKDVITKLSGHLNEMLGVCYSTVITKRKSARERQFVACNSTASCDTIKQIIYCPVYTIAGRSYSELCHLAIQQDSKSNS